MVIYIQRKQKLNFNLINNDKSLSVETKIKMSKAKVDDIILYSTTCLADNNLIFNRTHSAETLTKMSIVKGEGTINIYDT